ncbi:MAG: hypothetical protein ACRYFX_12865, partial [Janthinobacterium lividum]
SDEELELQRKRVLAQRDLELLNLGPTLAQERAIRQKFLGQQLAENEENRKLELEKHNLTEQEKQHIEKTYRDKAADTRQAFSTAEAQREVKARQDIIANAKAAELKLDIDYIRQLTAADLQAELDRTQASLAQNAEAQADRAAQNVAATQEQLEQEYQLQRRAVELERELALAQLDTRKDNAATELRIHAEANRKLAALDATQADTDRQRRAQELSEEARHYDLLAEGMLAGHNQTEQQQLQASEAYKEQRLAAAREELAAKLLLVKKGGQEEANARLESENKIKQIQADSQQAQLDLQKAQTEKIASVISTSLTSLATLADADSQAKLARIDAQMNAEGVSAARKAVLEKQKLRIEQEATKQRQKIARAQAVVQLGQAIMAILAAPSLLPSPIGEILKGVEIAAATVTAYAQFKAIDSQKFAQGGVLRGPSHAQGGIPLFSRRTGRALGAEAEGDEIILTKGVFRNPALRALASTLNVAGGGIPFAKMMDIPTRYMEGGVVSSSAEILPQILTGGVVVHTPPIDYDRLAAALAARPTDHEALADTLAAKLGPAFIAGARALPVPETNLTELRQRLKQAEKDQAQTDI